LLYPTNSKKLLNSSNGGVEEFTKNPLYKVQGCNAKRSGPLEIIAEIGGVQRRVVIDTGAEINVIARDFVWQNAWKKLVEEQKEEILGISNQVIIADGKLVLDVTIDGATIPVEFLVVPITNVYAILGIEFIRKYDVQLIFKSDDSQMKWRPNKDKKLRKVPLIINTQAPQLSIRKKVKFIHLLKTPNGQANIQTKRKATKTTKQTTQRKFVQSKESFRPSGARGMSNDISRTNPSFRSRLALSRLCCSRWRR